MQYICIVAGPCYEEVIRTIILLCRSFAPEWSKEKYFDRRVLVLKEIVGRDGRGVQIDYLQHLRKYKKCLEKHHKNRLMFYYHCLCTTIRGLAVVYDLCQ